MNSQVFTTLHAAFLSRSPLVLETHAGPRSLVTTTPARQTGFTLSDGAEAPDARVCCSSSPPRAVATLILTENITLMDWLIRPSLSPPTETSPSGGWGASPPIRPASLSSGHSGDTAVITAGKDPLPSRSVYVTENKSKQITTCHRTVSAVEERAPGYELRGAPRDPQGARQPARPPTERHSSEAQGAEGESPRVPWEEHLSGEGRHRKPQGREGPEGPPAGQRDARAWARMESGRPRGAGRAGDTLRGSILCSQYLRFSPDTQVEMAHGESRV